MVVNIIITIIKNVEFRYELSLPVLYVFSYKMSLLFLRLFSNFLPHIISLRIFEVVVVIVVVEIDANTQIFTLIVTRS